MCRFIDKCFWIASVLLLFVSTGWGYDTSVAGVNWTMSELVSNASGAVTGGAGTFDVVESVTAAAGDTLRINAGETIGFGAGVGLFGRKTIFYLRVCRRRCRRQPGVFEFIPAFRCRRSQLVAGRQSEYRDSDSDMASSEGVAVRAASVDRPL